MGYARPRGDRAQPLQPRWPSTRTPTPRHPEAVSRSEVLCRGRLPADRTFVLGTGGMVRRARESTAKEFIVATETGMLHRLRKENPTATYIPANERAVCGYMKMITPAKLLRALKTGQYEVTVDQEIADKARVSMAKIAIASCGEAWRLCRDRGDQAQDGPETTRVSDVGGLATDPFPGGPGQIPTPR